MSAFADIVLGFDFFDNKNVDIVTLVPRQSLPSFASLVLVQM